MKQTFGERLRIIRKRRGMTQGDLAAALGVTVQTVVRYESLETEDIRPARLQAIADALQVAPSELTGEREEQDVQAEEEIQVLTRGLRSMDPSRRENLIQLMMPLILKYQREEETDDDGSLS